MSDPMARLNEMSPGQRHAVAEEYLRLIVSGTIMGAASDGIVLTDGEVRQALAAATPEYPGTARVTDLVRRRATEQGIPFPEPLISDRDMTQGG